MKCLICEYENEDDSIFFDEFIDENNEIHVICPECGNTDEEMFIFE